MSSYPKPVLDALRSGNIREVVRLQGRPFLIQGRVVPGNRLGRTLGFPTANLEIPDDSVMLPVNGVYAVITRVGETEYPGIANIGIRPTLNMTRLTVEVHLFDFQENLYGELLVVQVVERIREERKFPNLEELKAQIARDVGVAKTILSQGNHPDPGT